MATPTFVAGACIVVVALLSYGTTQTHLLFRAGVPTCAAASCTTAEPSGANGVPDKASARPGVGGGQASASGGAQARKAEGPAAPASSGPRSSPSGSPGSHQASLPPPAAPAAPGGGSRGPQVTLSYRTLRTWPGGFFGTVTITNHGKSALAGWQLWMRYRSRLDHMWGARWFPAGSAPLSVGFAVPPAGQHPLQPGGSVRFTFRASGPVGPPSGCTFDGYRCKFQRSRS